MAHFKMLDGNSAAVQAISMADVKVIAAYPITPQSSIAESLSELVDSGALHASYARVESEHSALSFILGAQLCGVRTATATSSVGLALMHEICNAVSGLRMPIVMPVVNRALASPWSLWCDHQDSMAERDSGWLQFYCENVQEIFDLMLIAYRVAEHEDVLLPVMVCFDGFFLSHSMQKMLLPAQEEVTSFVGPYIRKNFWLDTKDPIFINDLITLEEFTEMKYQMATGFSKSESVFESVVAEFKQRFGRDYALAEGYFTDDAETIIVSMGSAAGTAKHVVRKLRSEGQRVGAIKITSFRPFPHERVRELVNSAKYVAVFDRSAGLGACGGPLYLETLAALKDNQAIIKNYIGGLGGRDVNIETITRILNDVSSGSTYQGLPIWIDLKDKPFGLRQAQMYV